MNTRERISRDAERRTIMTAMALGPIQAVDVDEWLSGANRVRSFVPRGGSPAPTHRAEDAIAT